MSVLKIIKSYFYGRRQFVQIDNAKSSEMKVISGVPKDSRLGPLFFLVYINALPEAINDLLVNLFLTADDTNLLASGASLQQSLANLERWQLASKLEVHPSQSKIVAFSGLQLKYKLRNEAIGAVISHRDLGFLVSSDRSW